MSERKTSQARERHNIQGRGEQERIISLILAAVRVWELKHQIE